MVNQNQEIDKLRLCIRRMRSAMTDLLKEWTLYHFVDVKAVKRAEDVLDFEADLRAELYESD